MRLSAFKTWLGAVAAACMTAGGAGSAKPTSAVIASDRAAALRLATFDQVWTAIRDHYYDPRFNGADWEAARARYRPLAARAASDSELLGLLRYMLATLRDAHTRVLSESQARDRARQQTHSAGLILFEVEGRPAVFDVRQGGPAAASGVMAGMEVLEVNGVPIPEALVRAKEEVGASSSERAALVLAYLRLIGGTPDQPLRLKLARADGRRLDVALERLPIPTAPTFESRILPSGIAYVRFDRFRKPVARLLGEALARHREAPGLIIDLRSNTGGDGKEGARAIAPLLSGQTLIARLATRSGKPPSALLGLVSLPLELKAGSPGKQIYSGPLVLLTNEGTASTSEVIAASLQERGRARVVGTRSCGCALGVLRYRKLRIGGALAISEVALLSGLGRRIEGAGIVPDRVVAPTLADLRTGRDRAIELAESEILRPGS